MISKKKKHLPHNAFRIIHVSENAIREFVFESILDKFPYFFDLLDIEKVAVEVDWEASTGALFMAVHDDRDDISINVDKAKESIGYTASSLLSPQQPYYVTAKEADNGKYELL